MAIGEEPIRAQGATHEPPLTPGPSPVRRERVARASLEPGEGLPCGRFMDSMRVKSLAISALHEPTLTPSPSPV